MALSSDLLSQFAKLTKPEKDENAETTVYGVAVRYDNALYAKIDGSDLLTPVATTADIKDGERVVIQIKNHTATVIGNITSPSARNNDVQTIIVKSDEASNKVNDFETIIADVVRTDDLNTQIIRINDLQTNLSNLQSTHSIFETSTNNRFTALDSTISGLNSKYATITDLTIERGRIDELESLLASLTSRVSAIESNNG